MQVATLNDTLYEGPETLTLTAAFNAAALKYQDGISGALRTANSATGTGTIVDGGTVDGDDADTIKDDDRPTVSVANVTAEEGSNAKFTVSVDNASTASQVIDLTLTDGTALAGTDYNATYTAYYYVDAAAQAADTRTALTVTAGQISLPANIKTVYVQVATLNDTLYELLAAQGPDILRAKGIIDVAGEERRLVFQAVHMILEGDLQRAWKADEPRFSRLVFIGRNLDEAKLKAGFDATVAV